MPTYKQGILARKMHHDVDGKKSGCLPPHGASVWGVVWGGSAQPHVLSGAPAEDRQLTLCLYGGGVPGAV